jgi:hypothetical protein
MVALREGENHVALAKAAGILVEQPFRTFGQNTAVVVSCSLNDPHQSLEIFAWPRHPRALA